MQNLELHPMKQPIEIIILRVMAKELDIIQISFPPRKKSVSLKTISPRPRPSPFNLSLTCGIFHYKIEIEKFGKGFLCLPFVVVEFYLNKQRL